MICMATSTSGAETGFTASCQEVPIPIFIRFAAQPIRTAHFHGFDAAERGPAKDGRVVLPFALDFPRKPYDHIGFRVVVVQV
jgi:hypothetical protein